MKSLFVSAGILTCLAHSVLAGPVPVRASLAGNHVAEIPRAEVSVGIFSELGLLGAAVADRVSGEIVVLTHDLDRQPLVLDRFHPADFTDLEAGDLDEDGLSEIVLFNQDIGALQVFQIVDSRATLVNVVQVPEGFNMFYIDQREAWFGQPAILFASADQRTIAIFDLLGSPWIDYNPLGINYYQKTDCQKKYETSYEGECSRSSTGPGIYACLEAAYCRQQDCYYLVCEGVDGGSISIPTGVAVMTACQFTAGLEAMLCAPKFW